MVKNYFDAYLTLFRIFIIERIVADTATGNQPAKGETELGAYRNTLKGRLASLPFCS
jgi:hypothetical protein